MRRGSTKHLINLIKEDGQKIEVDLSPLIDLASKNKVLLQLLIKLDIKDPLRRSQGEAIENIVRLVGNLSKDLDGFSFAFFKLVKPVSYVPADVDVLVKSEEREEIIRRIEGLGFKVEVKEPFCTTLVKGSFIVDVYVHPTLGGMIYMDGQELLNHVCIKDFNGLRIKSLESYAEALVSAAHAVYKERIYTLNDYFTVKEWTTEETFKLAKKLRCISSLNLVMKINEAIEKGLFEAPYKIPVITWTKLLVQKIINDPLTRSTSKNLVSSIGSKRGLKLLRSKFTRDRY
uniref:Nucleotidyltransferase family protein n=1 Tax=Fervidicoccus fontis TaxID=683846 RepID=A0A7J3SME8_9CREN